MNDVLKYSSATGEFAAYDEYNPLRKIEVDSSGAFIPPDGDPGTEFLLNFEATEGPTDTRSTSATQKTTDGDDVIFGDLGNDWAVGGTGKDHLYGGWGNDLLNADDDHDSTAGATDPRANDIPDTDGTYEDIAYGGAGRDVLIGNTGGDRLIDWTGEFNSYLVPFAPYGMATVSRTLQPQLPEYLYALSESDGADQTLGFDTIRNGEPFAELGAVIQKDVSWQEQTGAPDDPQAGNIPGGQRDVLRSANFNGPGANATLLDNFAVDSGSWTVANGALQVTADSKGMDAASVFYVDQALPGYYEVRASLKVTKPTAGWKANAYIIFDYYGATDFKFAGIDVALNRFVMGHRTAQGWTVDTWAANVQIKPGTFYNMLLAVNGTTATLMLDNKKLFSYVFAPRVVDGYAYNLNTGMVGVGSDNSRGVFDNITVQRIPPPITLQVTEEFTGDDGVFTGAPSGSWQVAGGRYSGVPAAGSDRAVSLASLPDGKSLAVSSLLAIETTLRTAGTGGIVFDYYTADDFKYVAVDAVHNQVVIGHHTKKGWFADAVTSRSIGSGDHKLAVSLKGTTVSVTLDGQAVTGFVYNAAVVDGKFGLFTANGSSSFDTATFRTDDPAFAAPTTPSALTASATSDPSSSGTAALTYESLGLGPSRRGVPPGRLHGDGSRRDLLAGHGGVPDHRPAGEHDRDGGRVHDLHRLRRGRVRLVRGRDGPSGRGGARDGAPPRLRSPGGHDHVPDAFRRGAADVVFHAGGAGSGDLPSGGGPSGAVPPRLRLERLRRRPARRLGVDGGHRDAVRGVRAEGRRRPCARCGEQPLRRRRGALGFRPGDVREGVGDRLRRRRTVRKGEGPLEEGAGAVAFPGRFRRAARRLSDLGGDLGPAPGPGPFFDGSSNGYPYTDGE